MAAVELEIGCDLVGRKWGNERCHVAELEIVRCRERRVERGVAGKVRSRMVRLSASAITNVGLSVAEAGICAYTVFDELSSAWLPTLRIPDGLRNWANSEN